MHPAPALATLLQAEPVPDVSAGEAVGGSAVGAFAGTLLVGLLLVAFAPDFLERKVAAVETDVLTSFLYGLVALVALLVVLVALVLTLIGIPFALLLAFVAWLLWVVGATIGYLAIADRIVDHDDGWLAPLLLAAAINGLVTLTGIGGVISFAVGATGFGAVLRGEAAEPSTSTARARR